MKRIEDTICEAIELIVDKAVNNAGYDKTIQAIIKSCVDETTGKYLVQYQDSTFYAYSSNLDYTYGSGVSVYVLVPGNDMTDNKTIIGAVDNLGIDYINQASKEDLFDKIGANCVGDSANGFNLSSYRNHNSPTEGTKVTYLEVLYDAEHPENNRLEINQEFAELYLTDASSILCGGFFKTNLDLYQKNQGNYGIIYGIDFYDNISREIVTRYYIVDVDNMEGNPYELTAGKRQYNIFDIDGENFNRISSISIFTRDFPNHKEDAEIEAEGLYDIFISNIELFAVQQMTEEEISSCGVTLLTPKGTFFGENALSSDTLTLKAQVKVKGKLVNTDNLSFYWFKENLAITANSYQYNQYGGRGWECLNAYRVIVDDEDGVNRQIEWVPAQDTYEVGLDAVKARKTNFKCIVIYNETAYSKIVTIENRKTAVPNITIESDSGTQFYYDAGRPNLTCKINGIENTDYTYVWAKQDAYGNVTILPEDSTKNDDDYSNYSEAVSDLEALNSQIASGAVYKNASAAEIARLENIINSYKYTQMVHQNKLLKVAINEITNFAIFKCSVYNGDTYLGTASITLSNSLQTDKKYSLVINGGNQTYQYNEYGVSPASKSLERYITIPALSFTIYDNNGIPLSEESLRGCEVIWKVPSSRSMLIFTDAVETEDDEEGYAHYSDVNTINYKIRDKFYYDYKNNDVELFVYYKDQELVAKTNLTFIKQGDDGTNGTSYSCKIIPNTVNYFESYPTFTTLSNSTSGIFNFNNFVLTNEFSDTAPFVVKLYKSGEEIFSGSTSGTTNKTDTGEDIEVLAEWGVLANTYDATNHDLSDFEINSANGHMKFTNAANSAGRIGANSIRCTVNFTDVDGRLNVLYATLPINIVRLSSANYRIALNDNTGFRYAVYSSDGTNPKYDDTKPFELTVYRTINNIEEEISDLTNSNLYYVWGVEGDYYDFYTGNGTYVNSENLIYQNFRVNSNQGRVKPAPSYNGLCVNNRVYCEVRTGSALGTLVGRIDIPVDLFLNRYGFAHLNAWDGNSIQINEEGGFILAPQMGAGKKDEHNSFTGVLMGEVRDPNKENAEVGLFGYSSGERSFFLDAETGDAYFRGTISNGDKDSLESTGSGIFIDKDGDFSVGDGSQYIKWIDDELNIQASHFTISISDSQSKDVQTILSEADDAAQDAIAAAAAALEVQQKANNGDFDGADGVGVDHTEIKYVVDSQGTTAPADSANWQPNIPSSISPGQFLWTRTTIYYTDNNDSTFFTVSRQGENGAPGGQGTAGINTATVYLYQRATTTPDKPLGDLTYTFASASITSGSLGNWNQNIGNLEGTNPIWVTAAVASSNTDRDIISRNEWSTPIKMAQNGQEGQPGQQGANGLNQATVYIYKRSSVAENAPNQTIYTFADGSFIVPSGWSKTIPPSDKNPCYVSSAVAIGNEDTATLIWNTPSILVEDGSDGISPTVAAIEGGVEITDADGNKTYIYNGSNGQSYYTYIRYATDSNGSNMSASPTGKTYIGVYSGTASSAPSSASAYAPWMKYIGSDAETYYAFVKYATNNQGANMQDNPASGYDYVGTYTGTKSAPTAADFHWSKYTGEPGQPATQYYAFVKYATNNQGANMQDSPDATHIYVGTYAGTKSNPTAGDYEWSLYVGSNGVSVTAVKEVYFLTTGTAPAQSTLVNGTAISNNADQTEHWTTVVPTYVTNGKYYKSLQTSLSSGTSPIFSTITLDEGLTTANANAAAAESLAQSANENASNALSKVQAKYANCTTQGNTVAKVATITPTVSNWSLFNGAEIFVKFSHANTATNPTLKINTTDAKPIKNSDGGDLTSTFYWKDNSLVHFVYDGTNWRMLDIVTTEKYNTLVSNIDGISQAVGTKASQTDLTNLTTRVTTNETNISQTATSITSLVSNQDTYTAPDGTTKTNTIKSAIKQNADNINLRVEKDGVISSINQSPESVTINANRVNIEGATIFTGSGRLSQTSLNNSYDAKGAAATAESNAVSTAAADATSKANAAQSAAITAAADDATSKANAVNNALEAYKTSTNSTLSSLQNQVDGQVEVWYYSVDPTTSNPPASTWNTDTLKARHEGDLYYNISNGHSWRWLKNGNAYSWQQIPDSDAAAALAKANEAMGVANNKRRIFTAQPTPPYDVGDLWVSGSDIKYCKTSKSTGGSYAAADWTLTATDDTKANSAAYEEQYIYISKVSGTLSVGVNETWVSRSDDVQNIWTTKRPTYNSNYPVLFVAKQKKTVSQSSGTSCSCSTPVKDDTTTVIDGGHITTGTIDASRLNVSDIIANGHIIVQGDNLSNLNNDSGFQTSSDVSSSISSATSSMLTTVTTKDQYYLSTFSSSATGGSWIDTVPTWSNGKYIWTRVATTKTTAGGTSTTTYSTAVYDSALTSALSTASSASSTASAAQTTANSAASTVVTTKQYYLSTSTSSATGGSWGTSVPTWSSGKYIWVRFEIVKTPISGTATTTYSPSSAGTYDSALTTALSTANTANTTANAATDAINNLEVGGRNLFATSTAVNGYIASAGTSISNMNATNREQTSAFIPVTAGEKYILQCWVPSIPSNSYCWLGYAFYTDTNLSDIVGTRTAKNGTNGVPYLAYTSITAPDTAKYIRISYRRFTDGYAKLEQGTMATDWTIAYEDTIAEEQRVYYRSKVNTKPNGNGLPTSWVTETGNKYNANATTSGGWSRKVTPISSSPESTDKYLYLWTCVQKKTVSGVVTYSDILLDDSTTVIDGGNIITGTVTANQLNATNINASGILTAGAIQTDTITVGSLKDGSNYATASTIADTYATQANLTTEINQRKANYGTCSTDVGTATKVVTCANFELIAGNELTVKFSTANTSSAAIQLNVNGKGNKSVWVANAVTSASNQLLWAKDAYITFRYDGAQFIVIGEPRSWYGASTTDAKTQIKTDTTAVTGCVICKGAKIELAMTNANTYEHTTNKTQLNIGSTGAKNIYYGNTTNSPTVDNGHSWLSGSTATFTFDGQYYRMAGQTVISGDSITTGKVAANFIEVSAITVGSLKDGSNYATTSSIPKKTSDLTNDSSFATTDEVGAAQSAAEATAKSYTDTAISKIEVGGRNYMINTGSPTTVNPPKLLNTTYGSASGGTVAYNNGVATYTTSSTNGEHYIRFTNVNNSNNAILANGLDTPGSLVFSGECFPTLTNSSSYWSVRVQFQINSSTSWSNNVVLTNLETGEQTTGTSNIKIANSQTDYIKFAVRIDIPENVTSFYLSFQQYGTFTVGDTFLYKKLKLEKGNKATDWSSAPEDVESSISDLESNAIASTVSVYYRSTTHSAPSVASSTAIGTAADTDNAWEYVMPVPKNGRYFYTCEKYTYVNGDVDFSTVRELNSETYASKWVSSNDASYINGGAIYAHSITADQIKANTITANELAANSITISNMDSNTATAVNSGVSALSKVEYYNRSCTVMNTSNTQTNYWRKFASYSETAANNDPYIIFDVMATGDFTSSKKFGRLKAHLRTGSTKGSVTTTQTSLDWINRAEGIDLNDFVLAYKATSGTKVDIELWTRCTSSWFGYVFNMVSEGSRTEVSTIPKWTLYDSKTADGEADITSGFTRITSTDIDSARTTATSYITYVSANDGIKVHNSGDITDYVQINSDAISICRNSTPRMVLDDYNLSFYEPNGTVAAKVGSSGLEITHGIIKLGDKTSVTDTTNPGLYVSNTGAFNLGNNTNYIRYDGYNSITVRGGLTMIDGTKTATVTSDGLVVKDNNDVVAQFGTDVTIGRATTTGDRYIQMSNDSMGVYYKKSSTNTAYDFHVSSTENTHPYEFGMDFFLWGVLNEEGSVGHSYGSSTASVTAEGLRESSSIRLPLESTCYSSFYVDMGAVRFSSFTIGEPKEIQGIVRNDSATLIYDGDMTLTLYIPNNTYVDQTACINGDTSTASYGFIAYFTGGTTHKFLVNGNNTNADLAIISGDIGNDTDVPVKVYSHDNLVNVSYPSGFRFKSMNQYWITTGYLTGSSASIWFSITLPRCLPHGIKTDVIINSLKVAMRSTNGGYVATTKTLATSSGEEMVNNSNVNIYVYAPTENTLTFYLSHASSWKTSASSLTNNTPMAIRIAELDLTFM